MYNKRLKCNYCHHQTQNMCLRLVLLPLVQPYVMTWQGVAFWLTSTSSKINILKDHQKLFAMLWWKIPALSYYYCHNLPQWSVISFSKLTFCTSHKNCIPKSLSTDVPILNNLYYKDNKASWNFIVGMPQAYQVKKQVKILKIWLGCFLTMVSLFSKICT